MAREYLQENQPEGVPPLPLTGERTLPDVPEENYWYRRHLVVYEWISARLGGKRVVDMACGDAAVSTPNLLTLAPPGAAKSDNPWHVREYRATEFRQLCEAHFPRVELYGLFHARKLRAHELALKLGWDRFHKALGLSKPFY